MDPATALPDTLCYLNGEFTALKDAKISVMDRGFIFGDGVYEVVPAYAGKLFRFAQHMARLDRSLAELRITNPLTHRTVFVMSNVMKLPGAEQRARGVACVTADDFRWEKAHIKSTSLLGAVFSRQISFDAGALETIMFRGDYLSEAAASNVWVIKDGTVMGPPRDQLVLEGIRYGLIEEICRAAGIAFELRRITRAEVRDADELLLSSATKEVLPVTLLDGQPVG
ncbi:MAG: D-amino acid aminotransferase, partial [Polaromonas sp. 35-63-240]